MKPRQFAQSVTRKLQDEGYTALFAGGCVRDALLGREPKDYDVATSATPDQVQQLFGRRKTIAIGKSFGVITVIGPKGVTPIEVATFRRDGGYSDGRRPDSVQFTDAREDAIRRDFTINGMFVDPVTDEVIDYVGGRADIDAKVIRAIGDAGQRIEDDKLRMLRAVRFASVLGFEIETETMQAVQQRASEIRVVSGERIGNELARMLTGAGRHAAFRLLLDSRLWSEVLPAGQMAWTNDPNDWVVAFQRLSVVSGDDFAVVIAALLYEPLSNGETIGHRSPLLSDLRTAWRLSNVVTERVQWILQHVEVLASADRSPWSAVQPVLLSPHAAAGVDFLLAHDPSAKSAREFCLEKLKLPDHQLNPPPLIGGKKLIKLGAAPGPQFSDLLRHLRVMQLDGELVTREDAVAWVQETLGVKSEE